jgi:23S rRNA maturation mini-RNase III
MNPRKAFEEAISAGILSNIAHDSLERNANWLSRAANGLVQAARMGDEFQIYKALAQCSEALYGCADASDKTDSILRLLQKCEKQFEALARLSSRE